MTLPRRGPHECKKGKKLNLWVWANEALYLKFEIYDPMIRGSGLKVGSI